ncbi:hypothetical protein HWV62_20180 [Athelia sp. TMB]|nr:hypothetical protein HWV62_20180 [Athelia sp. TMB]
MASASHKPLPSIPRRRSDFQRTTSYLTVEGREHLRTLIRSTLAGDEQVWREEGVRDTWAIALECALDELGKNIANGGWLTGVKRGRMAAKARRAAELRTMAEEKVAKQAEDSLSVKGKGKYESSEDAQKAEKDLPMTPSRPSSSTTTGHQKLALQQLRELISQPTLPTPKPTAKYLLLCVKPLGKTPSVEDSGFDLVPHNTACNFQSNVFSLSEDLPDGDRNTVLYGLHEWDVKAYPLEDGTLSIVGGTFLFKGVNSLNEQNALEKTLRISIYVYLSLLLEQHLLADSNVIVKLSTLRVIPTLPDAPPPARPAYNSAPPSEMKQKHRASLLPTSVVSFLSKKTENFFNRHSGQAPSLGRHVSLDVKHGPSALFPRSSTRASQEQSLGRLRRLSFLPESRPAPPAQPLPESPKRSDRPFRTTLGKLQQSRSLLSSSPGVFLEPPMLLVALANKEEAEPTRRLRADERMGLKSILGWEGRRTLGAGMIGAIGFVRQQEFTVLHSRHVPSIVPAPPPAGPPDASMITPNTPAPIYTVCDKARWITYQFYSRDSASDKTLGDAIVDLCSRADSPCDKVECQFKRGEHELRFIHDTLRIALSTHPNEITDGASPSQTDVVEMWQSCKICHTASKRITMSDGTYLFSFSKYLELLCYSPALSTPLEICEHTTAPSKSASLPRLPQSRLNVVRHFSYLSHFVSFELSSIEDIFELRIPRLQLLRMSGSEKASKSSLTTAESQDILEALEMEKKTLRREIKSWWQGVSDHMDKMEEALVNERPQSFAKSLPRLPSTDDAYDDIDTPQESTPKVSTSELPPQSASTPTTPMLTPSSANPLNESALSSGATTPKAQLSALPPLPPSVPGSPAQSPNQIDEDDKGYFALTPPLLPEKSSGDADLLHKLQNLRHNFQRTEQTLYAALSRTHASALNDVRIAFLTGARGATRRLTAWQKKHMPKVAKGRPAVGDLSVSEPEWWKKSCHALPGGNIIVREDDWGSIIAYTLGSIDYQRELFNMAVTRSSSMKPAAPSPSLTATTNPSSFFGAPASFTLFSSTAKPDPDQEGIVWHEPETYSAVIGRKEHPRDQASILSIREVLRNKNVVADVAAGLPSRFTATDSSRSRNASGITPPSAWAKPAVDIDMQAVRGEVSGSSLTESAGTILQQMSSESSSLSGHETQSSKSQFGEAHIRRGSASSLRSSDSGSTIGASDDEDATMPVVPPKDEPASPAASKSSYFATTVTNAMRYMLSVGETPRPMSPSFKNQHRLLVADPFAIDERPHIKYDWMIGKRLKFSCTVYYAKQFDILRRRCGIEDIFLKSLGQSANWAAEGGKSRSNFWKTSDDRFIIKTLVNAWNVADLSVLIDMAPSYFRYMETTSDEPTVLAKLLGFYTVEIKNLETSNTQAKADLLVMENLFFNQKIAKTFDLKGIQGRKVKAGSSSTSSALNKTLFDGEWIEGQQRALTLVRPHSKLVLQEAVKSDYLPKPPSPSLLLGVDADKKQIACGLVDTIGSYTFAKTIEYKAKQGLNAGKETTVIPPAEYQERFVKALDGYFLACPDKWSKPLDSGKALDGVQSLPCVL